MPKKAKAQAKVNAREWILPEDPILGDDIIGASLEWIHFEFPPRYEAVRKNSRGDPWERASLASENDCLTERRRRKFQHLSLNVDEDRMDDRGENVA